MSFTRDEQVANIIMDYADNSMDYENALLAAQKILGCYLVPELGDN